MKLILQSTLRSLGITEKYKVSEFIEIIAREAEKRKKSSV